MIRLVEDVFVTEGVPKYTFVPPPNFNEILLDIRRLGKPIVVEGQSGTGKTTCVKKVVEQLGSQVPVSYLTARNPADVSRIEEVVRTCEPGTFVIDDFHRLEEDLQTLLADLAKRAAERTAEAAPLPKLILIGINQVGSGLIQLVPDIAKRIGIHRIQPGSGAEIAKLIEAGCLELNVAIENSDQVFAESKGDYWLTSSSASPSA